MKRRVPARWFLAVVIPSTLAVAVLALLEGPSDLSASQVLQAIAAELGLADRLSPDLQNAVIELRLPRIAMAVLAGFALAIAGTIMQAVFRNPLASPEILGTAQGAALGATVATVTGLVSLSTFSVPLCAVAGAIVVTLLVYLIAGGARGFSVGSLLLAGIAMNTFVGALIAFAISKLTKDDWSQGGNLLFWLMGDFDKTGITDVFTVAVGLCAFLPFLLPFLRDLDLMTLKDDGASALGVNVFAVRSVLLVVACGITAVTVAFTGGIAFVGLVVPHMARLIVGPVHLRLMPCAAVLGAFMLLLSDYICRASDSGLRVGVVMSMLGAPFFLYLLIRLRRGQTL